MADDSDQALVQRAKAGDRRAFAALVDRHYGALHRFAWRCLGDAAEAEDAAQEALIRIARGLDGFEGRSSFTTWATGVALNCARDALRARRRRVASLEDARTEAEIEASVRDDAGPEEALWEAVRGLPEALREAVLLVHVEGFSHRAAAEALGCAEATVSWRLFSARRKLKSALARETA
ncbi:RNA polymerase sigma factor [Hansschlegelia sp. KR7-227]|uniref:RNA polymerase sigma factor n=1 Tax=Hansschlegelia sp. KR7-227 TaxID=3400914 RepID=UPI003C0218DD